MNPTDVFISYRRADVEFVKKLVQKLEEDGRNLWVDWEDIPPGVEGFSDEIQSGIEGANAFIAVLSPTYLQSSYCINELKEAIRLKKRIIPVVYQKFEPAPPPEGIGHINWIYFTPHAGQANTFEDSYPKVIMALETDFENTREHTRILLRATDWDKHSQNGSYLLKGAEIEKAESWQVKAVSKDPAPTELQGEYILASRKNQRKQQRRITIAIASLLVMALVAGTIAIVQGRISHSQALASAALLPGNEQYAVALAIEASRGPFVHEDVQTVLAQTAYASGGIRYKFNAPLDGLEYNIRYPAVSPDGERIEILNQLYDLKTGQPILTFTPVPGYILAGLYTSDEKYIVLAGDDDGVNDPSADPVFLGLYDAATGELVRRFDTGIGVEDIQLSTDERTLIGFLADGRAVWWDINTGRQLRIFDAYAGSQFSPDLKWLATVSFSEDGTSANLLLIDTGSMETVASIPVQAGGYHYGDPAIRFSNDSTQIAVEDQLHNSVSTYNVPDGSLIDTYPGNSDINLLRYSSDGSMLVAGCTDSAVTLWNLSTREIIVKQTSHMSGVFFADFVADDTRVISMDTDNLVIDWDTIPGNVLKVFPYDTSLAGFSRDGATVYVVESNIDQTDIVAYDMATFTEQDRRSLPVSSYKVWGYYVSNGLADGRAVIGGDDHFSLVSLNTGDILGEWSVPQVVYGIETFSDDGQKLLIRNGYSLELRSGTDGSLITSYDTEPGMVSMAAAISPNGNRLLIAQNIYNPETELNELKSTLIDVETGKVLATFDDGYFVAAFSQDGTKFVAITNDEPTDSVTDPAGTTVQVRSADTGELEQEVHIQAIYQDRLEISRDGKSIFTGRNIGRGGGGGPSLPSGIESQFLIAIADMDVSQWDLETGKLIRQYKVQLSGPIQAAPDDIHVFMPNLYRLTAFRLDDEKQLIDWACANRYIADFTPEMRKSLRITSSTNICDQR